MGGIVMTQEDKQLLLKDLCARLPYGVKVESVFINTDTKKRKSCGIEVFDATCILMIRDGFGEFKPYLFPLSSMTSEQLFEVQEIMGKNEIEIEDGFFNIIDSSRNTITYLEILAVLEWFYKNHFDINGLIEKGLAIDATGLNIY